MPLVHGRGPLTEANGFRTQADVLSRARAPATSSARLKWIGPEDIEANPKTSKVYLMLTNNTRRKARGRRR